MTINARRMAASIPRPLALLLLAVGVGVIGAVNLSLAARSVAVIAAGAPAVDWEQYVEASRRIFEGGELYAVTDTYAYHYSPILAPLFGLLAPIGTLGWRLFHLVAAVAMPTWPMRLIALVSWPLWYDIEAGNVIVFVVLATAWAIRGSRTATIATFGLALLIPRPLVVPAVAWLLWTRPGSRVPFAGLFVLHGVAVLLTGWTDEWIVAMLAAGGDVAIPSNVGPSRFIGTVPWLAVGIPLAAWLTWRGRVGLAGVAASPYWLPYYLLMPIVELSRWAPRWRRGR